MAMVAGTLLAVAALLSQVDNLALLWDTIENVIWLVAGSGTNFIERGQHELKGVPGAWRLFAVES
jgi:hypothetical protein